ncbi:vWA domain-containing protein [Elongatibacter sediminis]|uniref:VWA domain-containing protein n=1 Tax=Elongatibacter sediminis TaxID=3119006 RepID=A0AAW9R6G6_9GAMM
MAKKRETVSPFSLSFLDIMSCGFGAVVLLFLIIKHNVDANASMTRPQTELQSEVSMLEEEIRVGEANLVRIRNTIDEVDDERAVAEGLALRITREIERIEALLQELEEENDPGRLEALKARLQELERQKQQTLAEQQQTGEDVRRFAGDGQRAYVTGLRLDGRRILVLLDASSSMLDAEIVNVIRRRNMRDERKRTAPKWLQAVATVDWLTAKFPVDSQYQIYLFNTAVRPVLAKSAGRWLDVRDRIELNGAIEALREVVPEGGTNLDRAVAAVADLRPRPDNIYLITDGLPTQGPRGPSGRTISGRERLKLFDDAVEKLPDGIPVNVVLLPMEGDPEASYAYWRLAQVTRGSYITPSEDWP